jgi:hypothetical protein
MNEISNIPGRVGLREIGFSANRRLLGVQRLDHDPITETRQLHDLTDPVTTTGGPRSPTAARPTPQPPLPSHRQGLHTAMLLTLSSRTAAALTGLAHQSETGAPNQLHTAAVVHQRALDTLARQNRRRLNQTRLKSFGFAGPSL